MVAVVIQSILIFLTLSLPLLLHYSPASKRAQNLPLCLLMVLAAFHVLLDLTVDTPIFGSTRVHLLGGALIFLYGPLLWLYGRRFTGLADGQWWPHLLPCLAATAYCAVLGFSHQLLFPLFILQYTYYAVRVLRLASEQKGENGFTHLWLSIVALGFGGIWLGALSSTLLGELGLHRWSELSEQGAYLTAIVYFLVLLFAVTASPDLVRSVQLVMNTARVRPAGWSESVGQRMRKLEHLFTAEKLYTDAELNRETLAARLGVSREQLSTEVNTYFEANLPELINDYRIAEARAQLDATDRNVKEIYFAVGYNSRSVFNSNFKRRTGLTPTQYRENGRNAD